MCKGLASLPRPPAPAPPRSSVTGLTTLQGHVTTGPVRLRTGAWLTPEWTPSRRWANARGGGEESHGGKHGN